MGRRGLLSETDLAFGQEAALGHLLAVGTDRLVGEHQLPALSGPELRFDGIQNGVRGLVRRSELAALQRMDMRCQRGVAAAVPRGDVPSARRFGATSARC